MINLYWIASIWRQNEQKWVMSLRSPKTFASKRQNDRKPLNYKSDQLIKWSKITSQNMNWSSIWRQNDLKCWVTWRKYWQNIQNNAKLQKWSKYNDLHRFDVKTSKNVELRRKPFKTAKLQKWSTYTELHRFDVKTSKNVQLLAKHSKPLNSQSDQLILNCIDLTSKRSKMLSYVANHSKPLNYKSDQLILNCIDLTSKRAKMMSYVAKHSKLRKTTKVIKL